MALPNNPITRVESYLNRIATGSGDIPEYPMTRMEQYLDYIAENGGGSGLPDPSSLPNGTAMVAVNGEWKMQSGYGYSDGTAPIEWDGSTEGKTPAGGDAFNFYKVSDKVFSVEELSQCTLTYTVMGEEYPTPISASDYDGLAYSSYAISGLAGSYGGGEAILTEDGTYLLKTNMVDRYVLSSLATVHQFDSALIPSVSSEYIVNFTVDIATEKWTADKTFAEIQQAFSQGKNVIGVATGLGRMPFVSMAYFQTLIVDSGDLIDMTLSPDEEEDGKWLLTTGIYTLTPAT